MSTAAWRILLSIVFTVAIGALLYARHAELERLRREVERIRPAPGTLADLQKDHAQLEAARLSEPELASLRADHATIAAMRNEIVAVQRSLETRDQTAGASRQPSSSATLLDRALTAKEWRNVGCESPVATMETALWAAAHGDAGKLVETMFFSPEVRAKAEELFAALPADLRQEFTTADRFIGLMAARDIPTQSAQVLVEVPNPQGTMLVVNLKNDDNQSRRVSLRLRPDGNAWRIEVPPSAVERYTARARGPANALSVPALKVN